MLRVFTWMRANKNSKQLLGAGLTTVGSVFFLIKSERFLPDSPFYWLQQLRGGLWRDTNEGKHAESPAGTWTQEKRERRTSSRKGITLLLKLHATSALAFCLKLLWHINTCLILKHIAASVIMSLSFDKCEVWETWHSKGKGLNQCTDRRNFVRVCF